LRASLAPAVESEVITHVDCGGTPRTSDPANWDGAIPWLTPKEVTGLGDRLYMTHTARSITPKGLKSCSAQVLPPGTVMLTKRAPIGHVVINVVPMATNQGFLNFRCGKLLDSLYLAYWLRVNKPYLDLVANGTTYPELHQGDLCEFEIAIPPPEEQRTILHIIKALHYLVALSVPLEQSITRPEEFCRLREYSERLCIVRDMMLPMLLSGKMVRRLGGSAMM
jgi:type I restriction enzyme S subunit